MVGELESKAVTWSHQLTLTLGIINVALMPQDCDTSSMYEFDQIYIIYKVHIGT